MSQNRLFCGLKHDIINTKLREAREDEDLLQVAYWQTIRAMADMRSMRTWTLEQLEEQYAKTIATHSITVECI